MGTGPDPEWTLCAGDLRATVSPFGASLRRLWVEKAGSPPRDLLWGYTGTANKKGGQGDALIPFPGRVAGGTYTFEGQRQQLATNDKDGPNAIHGFLRSKLWLEGPRSPTLAQFATRIARGDHPGYSFDLEVVVGYELLDTGLACAVVMRNAGTGRAPAGAGFHPYLLPATGLVDGLLLRSPAGKLVEFDGLLPTGRVVDVPRDLDFRTSRPIGPLRLNHCFTGLAKDAAGFARVRFGDVELWMDDSFPYLVLYTGDALGPDARKALAVEPMTCATDAFNHPEWGLRVLQPGETMQGTWGITPVKPIPESAKVS
ncbi:MAG TPA: aldose epimerase [Candidatus Thermoplasmatota archaeon]|nr:aldose epimerase [Candidatus Thermoplasmatota archaeon]